jgi:hypothetical protein
VIDLATLGLKIHSARGGGSENQSLNTSIMDKSSQKIVANGAGWERPGICRDQSLLPTKVYDILDPPRARASLFPKVKLYIASKERAPRKSIPSQRNN